MAIAPNSSAPRLWLRLKPIQARHMSVASPDSRTRLPAIAAISAGSRGTQAARTPQVHQHVHGVQRTQHAEYDAASRIQQRACRDHAALSPAATPPAVITPASAASQCCTGRGSAPCTNSRPSLAYERWFGTSPSRPTAAPFM